MFESRVIGDIRDEDQSGRFDRFDDGGSQTLSPFSSQIRVQLNCKDMYVLVDESYRSDP